MRYWKTDSVVSKDTHHKQHLVFFFSLWISVVGNNIWFIRNLLLQVLAWDPVRHKKCLCCRLSVKSFSSLKFLSDPLKY